MPAGYLLSLPPADTSVVVPDVGAPVSGSFQRIRCAMEFSAASVSGTLSKVPMFAMPADCELKPCACAPTTGWSIPPARPSHSVPNLSTRKL